jgi:hypothetical protein
LGKGIKFLCLIKYPNQIHLPLFIRHRNFILFLRVDFLRMAKVNFADGISITWIVVRKMGSIFKKQQMWLPSASGQSRGHGYYFLFATNIVVIAIMDSRCPSRLKKGIMNLRSLVLWKQKASAIVTAMKMVCLANKK